MNIVYLEGKCEGVRKAIRSIQNPEMKGMFSVMNMKANIALTEQTRNMEPDELFDKILNNKPI